MASVALTQPRNWKNPVKILCLWKPHQRWVSWDLPNPDKGRRASGYHPWVDVKIPNDPNLVGKTVRIRIEATVIHPTPTGTRQFETDNQT